MIFTTFTMETWRACRLPVRVVQHFCGREIGRVKAEFRRELSDYFRNDLLMTRRKANDALFDGEMGWKRLPELGAEIRGDNLLFFFDAAAHGLFYQLVQVQVVTLPENSFREILVPTPPEGKRVCNVKLDEHERMIGLISRRTESFLQHLRF